MKTSSLNRRDFLKLAALSSLSLLNLSEIGQVLLPERLSLYLKNGQPPNILILVFDTLSARNMSLYGYPRATTPSLERISQRAIVFHQHHAPGNFTIPGTTSFLTGVYPWAHRAINNRSQPLHRFAEANIFNWLPEDYYKFAYTQNPYAFVLLHQYRHHIDRLPNIGELAVYSATYTDNVFKNDFYVASEAEILSLKVEFDQPASLFLSLLDKRKLNQDNKDIIRQYRDLYPHGPTNCRVSNPGNYCFALEDAIDWTQAQVQSAPQPFFGYVHLFPPHAPYNARAEFSDYFDDGWKPPAKPVFPDSKGYKDKVLNRNRRFYDQSIAYVDAEFKRLYDSLERSGALENTILVFTSDHGELLERGVLGHSTSALYEPIIHIPLLVWFPGQNGRQDIHIPSSATDMVPTLLKLAGSTISTNSEGVVLPGFGDQTATLDRSIYAVEAKRNAKLAPLSKATIALLKYPYKLIMYLGYKDIPDSFEFYDLSNDPEELLNIYSPNHPAAKPMVEELQTRLRVENQAFQR